MDTTYTNSINTQALIKRTHAKKTHSLCKQTTAGCGASVNLLRSIKMTGGGRMQIGTEELYSMQIDTEGVYTGWRGTPGVPS